ncbi:GDP-mannose 4,6-dehydratase [Rickettsiales endosymbiont of Stachyamoeba lipophora]|uniref:GDP-mannose 4,6-dehydratase n=1 Tax=Rickettsiales endosymbiont of Stachyamoeba lipophora TaxID=2486578 RepID=UPI0019D00BA6|nr:GDP-mannose 4,6-dehydratase [Rickettsiales endosymbiont of Stachyamoeba lipophora]
MYLVTGCAGFIGFHLVETLLANNQSVIGIDYISEQLPYSLKQARLNRLLTHPKFVFYKVDLCNKKQLYEILDNYKIEYIIHLAAQTGVRYSAINPSIYIKCNIDAHLIMLEYACKIKGTLKHFIYASSSSVYGNNYKIPFQEKDITMEPTSVYAATKLAGEHLSYSFSSMYNLPITGLRFFTVYGEWGRPDMAFFSFTDKIYNGRPIEVFGNGSQKRDFTYIQDVIYAIIQVINLTPSEQVRYQLLNIGNNYPVSVNYLVELIEQNLKTKAIIEYQTQALGDVNITCADITKAKALIGYAPKTSIEEGMQKFIDWYLNYKLERCLA